MRTVGKWIAAIIAAALVAGLGWMVYGKVTSIVEEPDYRRAMTVPVDVAAVEIGTIRDVRQFTGTLRATSHYEVASRVAGRLERLAVDIGDTVEQGQVVAWLDDEEYVQQVEQVRAELEVARATLQERQSRLQIAQRDHQRVERLRDQKIASESELDAAMSRLQVEQAGLRVAAAQVTQREAAVAAAEVRLAYTQIRATWQDAGRHRVVGERFVDAGATLSPNSPIISLLDIDTLLAVVNVTERDYAKLSIGQQATLQINPGDERVFAGKVARIAPMFYEGSRQARMEIEVPNEDRRLKPGMFIRVNLELDAHDDAVIIPRQALIRREGRSGVFIADPDSKTASFVPVKVGITAGQRVEVLEPAITGLVVTLGQHLLSHEATISIADLPNTGGESRDDESQSAAATDGAATGAAP